MKKIDREKDREKLMNKGLRRRVRKGSKVERSYVLRR